MPRRRRDELAWDGVVATSTLAGGFAYVPNRALIRDAPSIADLRDHFKADGEELDAAAGPAVGWTTIRGTFDVIRLVGHLRAAGYTAQPDHVFFAHASCCCCCSDHPADLLASPLRSNPLRSNPLRSNPLRSNPLRSNPLRSNPLRSNSDKAELPTKSSARPAAAPNGIKAATTPTAAPVIAVIDTGLAASVGGVNYAPQMLKASSAGTGTSAITGTPEGPDVEGDGWLDPVAGHGTFIAGLIELHAPGCAVTVHRAVKPQGQVRESDVVGFLAAETKKAAARRAEPHNTDPPVPAAIISMSFGGRVWERASLFDLHVREAQRQDIVIVASAGNDGSCEPVYPAAFDGVIGVGGIGPHGPSPFTNYGDWVRACAPAEDLTSAFFRNWNGNNPSMSGTDIDSFDGWAVWSGTSFAVPIVVAALVREIRRRGCTAPEAVKTVIDAPHLGRIPGLGTVVNL